MDEQLAIRTSNLRKVYDETVALDGLDLRVPEGTVYGFLGPNGAGKTTTMRILTTLTRPTDGTAFVAGHSIDDAESIRPHVGYLPENPPVYDALTGREVLRYFARLRDIPDERAADRIEALLDRFDLVESADDRVATYSTGMRKKIGLIQAVIHEPDVLFLDEPTAGLDPRAARTARETIADVADRAGTVFLSTHHLPVVEEVADAVGVLHDGQLAAEGSPAELKRRAESGTDGSLEEAFLEVTDDQSSAAETSP